MIWEEASIAEKIIKLFPKESIELNKKFNNRKPDIWFKDFNIIIEVDEGNHGNYDSDNEKERKDMFKKHNFKIFRYNPNDPKFDIFKFLGEINLYISELRKKDAENGVINKNWINYCWKKKYLVLIIYLKKQTITLKLQKLKINLMIIIMLNILLLQSLIN